MNLERAMTISIGSVTRKDPLKLQLEGMEHPSGSGMSQCPASEFL